MYLDVNVLSINILLLLLLLLLLLFDRYIAKEVKLYRRSLTVAWTDVKKAYDSLYQEFIITSPRLNYNMAQKINVNMENNLASFQRKRKDIVQGNFYRMWNFSGRFTKSNFIWFSIRNNIIYHQTDEVWVYTRATRQQKLKSNENTWFTHRRPKCLQYKSPTAWKGNSASSIYDGENRIKLRIRQVFSFDNKSRKKCTTKSVKITDEKIIEGLKEGKFYEHLGMSQRADCEEKVIKDALKKESYRRNRIVWKSLLSASNKVKASNSICVGVLSYSFGVVNWTKVELEEMDIRVRKEMTMNKAFNKHSDTGRLYLLRNRGGKGLICIQDFCERMCVSTLGYVLSLKSYKEEQSRNIIWTKKKAPCYKRQRT